MHHLKDINGNIFTFTNITQFCRQHELYIPLIHKVVCGKLHCYNGYYNIDFAIPLRLSIEFFDTFILDANRNIKCRVAREDWWYTNGFKHLLEQLHSLYDTGTLLEKLYRYYYTADAGTCKVCSSPTTFVNFKTGYRKTCSVLCSSIDADRIEKIKANTDYTLLGERQKRVNQMLRDNGTYAETRKRQVEAAKATKTSRYGNPNYNNPVKQSATVFERYGVKFASLIPAKVEKTKQVFADKRPQLRDKELLIDLNTTMTLEAIAETLNVTPSAISHWFKSHNIDVKRHTVTRGHLRLIAILEELGVLYTINDRTQIGPYELDIYLPDYKIGIEYNGCFWHKCNKTRHLHKLNLCLDKGIDLIQFWDFEVSDKFEICKSIILSRLNKAPQRIYARKCSIRDISNEEYYNFCVANHIQGYAQARVKYGLFHNDELVFVCSFSKSRFHKKFDWELIRSVSKLNVSVIGGFTKLLSHFAKHHTGSLVTYTDRRLFSGKSLIGFTHLYNTKPNYFYYSPFGPHIKSRYQLQKKKLAVLFPNTCGTEQEILLQHNWYPVYDCGSSVTQLI